MVVVNLFAFRSTDPSDLKLAHDPVGPENDAHIRREAMLSDAVICAWGQHGTYRGRSGEVRQMLMSAGIKLHCLRRSKSGQPAHPLYLPAHLSPVEF
jgi:hypothetical protein